MKISDAYILQIIKPEIEAWILPPTPENLRQIIQAQLINFIKNEPYYKTLVRCDNVISLANHVAMTNIPLTKANLGTAFAAVKELDQTKELKKTLCKYKKQVSINRILYPITNSFDFCKIAKIAPPGPLDEIFKQSLKLLSGQNVRVL